MITRSIIFVPGNKEKMLMKTPEIGADAAAWDLEDAVVPAEKDLARTNISNALETLQLNNLPIYVRINALSSNMMDADLKAIVKPGLYGVMLPKVESAEQVILLETELAKLEKANGLTVGAIKIHCIIETCLGALNTYNIVTASPRIDGISFGAEDFTLDLGTSRSREGIELDFARGSVALASGAAKIMAIDTVFSDLQDEEGFINECRKVRQLGFKGKFAIHPKQVTVINREFSPSEKEMEYARKVVDAFAKANEAGEVSGVITVDGKMVDIPVAKRAQLLVETFGKQ